MKLKNFIGILALMLVCCFVFGSKGKSYAGNHRVNSPTISKKLLRSHNFPPNTYLTINLLEGNQEITQQFHKTRTSLQIEYLSAHNFSAYVKCINFFSEHNDQRYTLLDKVFLFPFHAFW